MEKLYGPIMQMGFVVDDFEEPIKHWTEKLNIGPFLSWSTSTLKIFIIEEINPISIFL